MNRAIPRPMALPAGLALLCALALGACASGTSQPAVAGATTGHPGCFDPSFARGFTTIDDDVLLVDAGRNHYRVQLDATCFHVDNAAVLRFKGDPITGRVCGRFGESVSWQNQECQIQRVDWISLEEHKALLDPPAEGDVPVQ